MPLDISLQSQCDVPFFFFFFNDTATTEIYTLSLHDALPISQHAKCPSHDSTRLSLLHFDRSRHRAHWQEALARLRSEEHTSELQSRLHLVCRLLLEKKKGKTDRPSPSLRVQPEHRIVGSDEG